MVTSVQTCYRHPDRKAGVRCQRCERPICPSCMRQASVGFHCPECAKEGRQRVYTARSMVTQPVVTLVIIAINVAVFFAGLAEGAATGLGRTGLGELGTDGALVGHDWLYNRAGIPVEEIGVATGEWWRIVTGGFLHAGLMHIGFNMFLLWQLGQMLEPALGRLRFAVLYTMSLLGGSFLVLAISPDQPTVGASGAVFGLMGAAFVGLRARGIDPFSTGIGGLIVLNLLITFAFSRFISVGGHVGGLLAGALGGYLLLDLAPRIKNGNVVTTAICTALCPVLFFAGVWIAYNPIT